jgi:hypothetical protein
MGSGLPSQKVIEGVAKSLLKDMAARIGDAGLDRGPWPVREVRYLIMCEMAEVLGTAFTPEGIDL